MKFKDAASIESIIWDCKLNDLPRASNRARINDLFNGVPPYTPQEVAQNRINTNCNYLDGTRIAHDARRQFNQAFLRPGNFMNVRCNYGPPHRRAEWSQIITEEINRAMKRSMPYAETLRNVFAQVVLHGTASVVWPDKERWCPQMFMIGDVLLPSRTLRTMENLPYFAVFRRYTAAELYAQTHGPKVDKGWNMSIVNKALKWAAEQRGRTISGNEMVYSPEKLAEDLKADSGLYASDQVPTIDCWDFYYLEEDAKEYGWKRRIVLDTPTLSEADGAGTARSNVANGTTKNILGGRNEYLYNPGNRNYASALSEIIHFQFADGNVVAPFRYHSVRSLGFLLYAVVHLQNRLRCKFNDHVFESLLQYFRINDPNDAEKMTKIDLINLGIIPEGVTFVPPTERWQIQEGNVTTAMQLNRQTMADNSTSYTQDFGLNPEQQRHEKTATQVAAEVNSATAMVGGMLQDAYGYQVWQDEEIARRFCRKNSRDGDVRAFRAACLSRGVPEEAIVSERWRVSHEQVIGNGNKQVQLGQVNMLMQNVDRYEPDAQREILRQFTFAVTDDATLTDILVPEQRNQVTDSVHDAQVSAATLLLALPMGLRQGVNHGEYAATQIGMLHVEIQKLKATGAMATREQLAGLQNLAGQTIEGQPLEGNGAQAHIQILAREKANKAEVKQLMDALGQQMNEVKALAQQAQQAEQAQAQQQNGQSNGNQLDPKVAADLKAKLITAETKAEISKAAHTQKLEQKKESHQMDMANRLRSTQVEEAALDLRTAAEIRRDGNKPEPAEALST